MFILLFYDHITHNCDNQTNMIFYTVQSASNKLKKMDEKQNQHTLYFNKTIY